MARALVAEPSLLLFDEPLSNLDAALREEIRHEIHQLAKEVGITSLYVTHDQPEAFAVSDRVAVVLGGVIAQVAAPEQLYTEPDSLEVAQFVGRLSTLSPAERVAQDRVRVAGVDIKVTSATASDSPVLGVHPEAVTLAHDGDPGLDGEVLRATFLGERTELEVETHAGGLRADIPAEIKLRAGDRVRLAIRAGRLYANPD